MGDTLVSGLRGHMGRGNLVPGPGGGVVDTLVLGLGGRGYPSPKSGRGGGLSSPLSGGPPTPTR